MQPIAARVPRMLSHGTYLEACDNSGAKILRIISIFGSKTVNGRKPAAAIGDLVMASVRKGTPEMRKQVVFAVIVRQKKALRRISGEHIGFDDNAAVVVKDEAGNPKGTIVKGPIAKEVAQRWPPIAKIASVVI